MTKKDAPITQNTAVPEYQKLFSLAKKCNPRINMSDNSEYSYILGSTYQLRQSQREELIQLLLLHIVELMLLHDHPKLACVASRIGISRELVHISNE